MSTISIDLTPFFKEYEQLVGQVTVLYDNILEKFPKEVTCKEKCADCCHAMFDLSLIEALYINNKFLETFDYGPERSKILENANTADRHAFKLKRHFHQLSLDGKDSADIISEAGKARVRCPLLNAENSCSMYAARPITCRVYGVPTAINNTAHTCQLSQFAPGKEYPTINLDAVNKRLSALSQKIAEACQSKFAELHQVYVPVSMALMTQYTDEYMGIKKASEK